MTLARRSVTSDHLHVLFPNVRLSVNDTIILASNLSSSTYRDFINYTSRFVYDLNHAYCHVGVSRSPRRYRYRCRRQDFIITTRPDMHSLWILNWFGFQRLTGQAGPRSSEEPGRRLTNVNGLKRA